MAARDWDGSHTPEQYRALARLVVDVDSRPARLASSEWILLLGELPELEELVAHPRVQVIGDRDRQHRAPDQLLDVD